MGLILVLSQAHVQLVKALVQVDAQRAVGAMDGQSDTVDVPGGPSRGVASAQSAASAKSVQTMITARAPPEPRRSLRLARPSTAHNTPLPRAIKLKPPARAPEMAKNRIVLGSELTPNILGSGTCDSARNTSAPAALPRQIDRVMRGERSQATRSSGVRRALRG